MSLPSRYFIKQEYLYFVLLTLIFSIPLSQYVSSKLLAVSVVLAILCFKSGKGEQWLAHSWDLLLFLLISVVGLLHTGFFKSGLSELETRLGLLGLPLVFTMMSSYSLTNLNKVYKAFVSGLIVACFICLGNAVLQYSKGGDATVFVFYNLTNILNFQPTYFAYYIVFAITLLTFQLYNSPRKIVLNMLIVLFLFIMLMLTGGQTTSISLLFILAFFGFKYLTDERKTLRKLVVVGLVVCLLIAMFGVNMKLQEGDKSLTDSWDRIVIWEAALKASPDLIFGVGTGAAKTVLDNYYLAHGLERYANKGYNSHNQFIQVLLSNGVLGLLTFILMLARPLYLSFKSNNVLAILMMFPFLIYGMTEVFLGRYQGVIFFTLLHQFVVISSSALGGHVSKSSSTTLQLA